MSQDEVPTETRVDLGKEERSGVDNGSIVVAGSVDKQERRLVWKVRCPSGGTRLAIDPLDA